MEDRSSKRKGADARGEGGMDEEVKKVSVVRGGRNIVGFLDLDG